MQYTRLFFLAGYILNHNFLMLNPYNIKVTIVNISSIKAH